MRPSYRSAPEGGGGTCPTAPCPRALAHALSTGSQSHARWRTVSGLCPRSTNPGQRKTPRVLARPARRAPRWRTVSGLVARSTNPGRRKTPRVLARPARRAPRWRTVSGLVAPIDEPRPAENAESSGTPCSSSPPVENGERSGPPTPKALALARCTCLGVVHLVCAPSIMASTPRPHLPFLTMIERFVPVRACWAARCPGVQASRGGSRSVYFGDEPCPLRCQLCGRNGHGGRRTWWRRVRRGGALRRGGG